VAIYHLHAQIIKRSSGRSAVAAAAYRAGEKIHNERDGITHDYTRKTGVVHSEIMLPDHAPQEYSERSVLWNAVEKAEKRCDSQTAREFDIALPNEFDRQEQIELVREYVQENFVDKGMCADIAIHDKSDGNPHAHIMLTTREISESGFGGKNREWNKREQLESWRENWANVCNEHFQAKGIDERIDHRTLEAQGIDREPTIHEGLNPEAKKQNQEIMRRNAERTPEKTAEYLHELSEGHFILHKEGTEIKQELSHLRREIHSLRATAEEIQERAEYIQDTKQRLEILKNQRRDMGLFSNKKDIDSQIQHLGRLQEQATAYFERKFHIAPEESAVEVKQLEQKISDNQHKCERLQEKLIPMHEEKEIFLLEYQRHKLFADISHDREKIFNRLAELEEQGRPQKQSAQYAITQAENQRLLDSVSERNFEIILKDTSPEKQKALAEIFNRATQPLRERGRF
jgi:heme oxygenase